MTAVWSMRRRLFARLPTPDPLGSRLCLPSSSGTRAPTLHYAALPTVVAEAAAHVARLAASAIAASPLLGIVAAALACVGLTLAGLLALQAIGLVRRRPAFTLLMTPQQGNDGGAASAAAASEYESCCSDEHMDGESFVVL